MRKGVAAIAAILLLATVGCRTTGTPQVLSIPTTRDYQELPPASLAEATQAVAEARKAGAAHSAPYEYFSAEQYLEAARDAKGDAERDYSALALQMAEAALRAEPSLKDATPIPDLSKEEGVRTAFTDLAARLKEFDRDKTVEVAPVLYARATAELSRAEYLLTQRKGWKTVAGLLPGVSADLDTIRWQDSDADGVTDLKDGAPLEAEDADGFEDADGVPDLDNDRDGIPDSVDRAPMAAETRNRWHDEDGAVDEYPTLEPVFFAEGSTALSPDARGYLHGLKVILDEAPELKMHIKGFADDLHSDTYSMDLSQRRAQEVQRYLMILGVTGDRLVSTFHGQSEATVPNAGNRVELAFE